MNILTRIRSMKTRTKVLASSLAVASAIALPIVAHAGFYPGRTTFDYNKYDANNQNCDDANNPAAQNGRCGSMDGPVFNSFVNTPSYGDERYFTDGYRTDRGKASTADTITDVTDGSKQVVIRMYVHNNANQDTNASGKGVAHNAKVKLELPTNSGSSLQAVGAISASNSAPGEVSDTVYMTAGRAFHVKYVPGSAKLLRNTNSYALSDNIVSSGAPIGNTQMNGELPGCFNYAALVEVTVDIIPEPSQNLQLVKQVKNVGDTSGWHKEVASKPNQEQQFMLTTKNVGLDQLTDVSVRDILPPHVSLVPGSVKIVNADSQSYPQDDGPLFGNGIGLGNYPSGGGRYVLFKVKSLDDFDGCSVRVRNVAKAKSAQTPNEITDSADIVITKENCAPTPSYSCDLLSATVGDNRQVRFTTNASASNAQIKLYRYNFGDGTSLVTDKNVINHTYANAGQYAASVTVDFLVNGQTANAGGDKCAVAVTINPNGGGTSSNPSVTGGAPTSLVNTGPGSMVAVFIATSLVGAVLYRFHLGRKFNS